MEMEATGKSHGQWVFHGEFDRTVNYLSDQKKILGFNPFCHSVEPLGDDAYRWLFRVTDPQNNPFDVVFNVKQADELLLELPQENEGIDVEELTEEMISEYTVGRKITWRHHPVEENLENPEKYLFEGKASADMLFLPLAGNKTRVDFDLRIDVKFILYPAFRIIPEQIIRVMTNAGMSLIMQTATNKMFQSISNDFGTVRQM
ncbi:MAG: hypothetical protein HGB29_00110 [Chlorobiaceae bacterium]|nr:hypothetical protein [Chlorobiaceae bacterium]NTW73249.1 hypothetical protein [Chlorobiaceae bacterium]